MLDAWVSTDWSGGVHIAELQPLDRITLTTERSVYTMIVVSPHAGEVLARGGALLPSFTTVHVCGSSFGRGPLKRDVVHPGFCLELSHDEMGVIVTTPVQEVVVTRADRTDLPVVM